MVKPKSPRILAAAAVAALVVGLSSCGAPQTLQPYTPAEGVNVDVPRQGAPADSNEIPLKVRNLLIIAEPGTNTGIISGAILAPSDRPDRLISIEGRTFNAQNEPVGPIQPIQADVELPAGTMVVLTEGSPLEVTAPELGPGLIAELKLTFANSQEQLLLVPIIDGNKPDYATVTPAPAPAAETPAAG